MLFFRNQLNYRVNYYFIRSGINIAEMYSVSAVIKERNKADPGIKASYSSYGVYIGINF